MEKKKFYTLIGAYIFFFLLCSYYVFEHISSLVAVVNYEVGTNFAYLYQGYEHLFIFRIIENVMPLGISVEVGFITLVKGFVYIMKSIGIAEAFFLLYIVFLLAYNYFVEEDQKDIVCLHNALMWMLSAFLIQIIIFIILFLLAIIFLKILYETAFLIVSIVLIINIIFHLFILVFQGIKFYKFLKVW